MVRDTLLFWLLQLFPFLTYGNAAFNAKFDNCIDFHMANVEELIHTLRTVENSRINDSAITEGDGGILQPFGNLKTDWYRLHLLHDALPDDSLLKNKFKHLFKLLIIAHNHATSFFLTSASTKLEDSLHKQSTVSSSNEDRANSQETDKSPVIESMENRLSSKNFELRVKFKTTPVDVFTEDVSVANTIFSASDLSTSFSKSIENDGYAVMMKSMTRVPVEHSEKEESNVAADTANLATWIESSTTTTQPISTFEFRDTSAIDSISISVSEEEIVLATPMHEESNSSGKATKETLEVESSTLFAKCTTPSIERILKEEFKGSSILEEYSPVGTILTDTAITEIPYLNSMSSVSASISMTEETKIDSSPKPATTVDPAKDIFITEEYSIAATISSFVPDNKETFFVSIPSDKPLISSTLKTKNNSWVQSIMDPLLVTNFTTESVEEQEELVSSKTYTKNDLETKNYSSSTRRSSEVREYSNTWNSTKVLSTENASVGSSTTEENNEIELKSLNNITDNSLSENSTNNLRSTTVSVESVSSVTRMIDDDGKIRATTEKNPTEVSISENSFSNVWSTTDSIERVSSIFRTIEKNSDVKLSSQDNQPETSMSKNSTFDLSSIQDSMETTSSVRSTIEHDEKNQPTNLNDEWKNALKVSSIPKVWSTANYIERVSSVTGTIDKNEYNKLTSQKRQMEISIIENSTADIRETKNTIESISNVGSLIEKNEKNDLTIENNPKEIPMVEKTTAIQLSRTYSTENVSIAATVTTEGDQEVKSTSRNNETKVLISDKSVLNDEDVSNTTRPTFVSTTLEVTANTTELFSPISVSIESSINQQDARNNYENNLESTTSRDSNDDVTIISEISEPLSHSETWLIKMKPYFVKNPLKIDTLKSNKNIFRDYKHGSDDSATAKNFESSRIILSESGAGAKTGSIWRPQLARHPPVGNNIWRLNGYSGKVGSSSKADIIRKDEKSPANFSSLGNRMNLLRSRKRGSTNSDIEKQFRWFYRDGRSNPAHKSRDKGKDNPNIKIQCEKAQ